MVQVEAAVKIFAQFKQSGTLKERVYHEQQSREVSLLETVQSPYCPHTYAVIEYEGNESRMLAIYQKKDEQDLQALYENTEQFDALDKDIIMKIARGCVAAVRFLHAKDVVHCDLKFENFLVNMKGKEPEVHITDFGCSRLASDPALPTTKYGTRTWNPPEATAGTEVNGPISKKADIWALGLMLYALSGWTHKNFSLIPELDQLDKDICGDEAVCSVLKDLNDTAMLALSLEALNGRKAQRAELLLKLKNSELFPSPRFPVLERISKQMLRYLPAERIDIEQVWQEISKDVP